MSDERRYPTTRIRSSEIRYELQPSNPEAPREIGSSDELSEKPPVAFGIDSTRGTSENDFGAVEIRATNATGESITVRFGVTPPFSSYVGGVHSNAGTDQRSRTELLSNPEGRLYLIPVNATDSTINGDLIPDSSSDDLWRITTRIDVPQVGHRRTLAPGETISRNYAVLAPSRQELPSDELPADSCGLLSGEYAFREEYALLKGEPEQQTERIRWRFVVEVAE